jgi:hypothetical protein
MRLVGLGRPRAGPSLPGAFVERSGLKARLITGRARASPTGSNSCRARHAIRAGLSPGPLHSMPGRARVVLKNRASCRANGPRAFWTSIFLRERSVSFLLKSRSEGNAELTPKNKR